MIHCYEIATKSLKEIVASLISKENFSETVFVICVDLSKPETIIDESLEWIEILRKETDKLLHEKLSSKHDVLTR